MDGDVAAADEEPFSFEVEVIAADCEALSSKNGRGEQFDITCEIKDFFSFVDRQIKAFRIANIKGKELRSKGKT